MVKATESKLLQDDVTDMLREWVRPLSPLSPGQVMAQTASADTVAHDIIVVVRERVLRELESYARENIR